MSQGELTLELRSGSSDRTSVCLRPGQPLEPLSLGRRAFWQILAEGVSDVHAFIYFDGDAVFIASSDPNNLAVAGGALIGADWNEIVPPCEIHLGHALLLLRLTSQPAIIGFGVPDTRVDAASVGSWERRAEMDFDDGEFATGRVDGRNLESEHRKRKPRIKVAQDDDEPTRLADPSTSSAPIQKRKSRRKPKIKVPSAEEATRYNPIEEPPTAPFQEVKLVSSPSTKQMHTEPGPFPAVSVAGHAPRAATPPAPAGPMPTVTQPIIPTTLGFLPPGVGQDPAWSAEHQPSAAAPAVGPSAPGMPALGATAAVAPMAATAGAASTSPAIALTTTSAGASGKRPAWLIKIAQGWKQATLPQKAILCLLPFAFAAVTVMFDNQDPRASTGKKTTSELSSIASQSPSPSAAVSAPRIASASTGSTAQTAPASSPSTAASVASTKPATTPTSGDKGPRQTVGKGAPPRTSARQASDAVAAGSYTEAIKLYDQLASEHPDMAVYKEAARILRAKMAEPK